MKKNFKNWCVKNGSITENTTNSYISKVKTGLNALKKIFGEKEDLELINLFLENPQQYREKFENNRNNVVDVYEDSISAFKKYKEFLETSTNQNFNILQKIYNRAINSNNSVFKEWFPRYQKNVENFILYAKNDNWTDENIHKLVFQQNNSIANFGQGFLQNKDKEKFNFDNIRNIVNNISITQDITTEQYQELCNIFGTPN